jgi:hypothetical protein
LHLLKFGYGLGLLLLGLLLWHCDVLTPPTNPPPHRIDTVTTWNPVTKVDSVESVVILSLSPEDSISTEVSRSQLLGPPGPLKMDTTRTVFEILHFKIQTSETHVRISQTGLKCTVDSGIPGTTTPPITSNCLTIAQDLVHLVRDPHDDTVKIQTTYDTIFVLPFNGPIVASDLPLDSTLRVRLAYPTFKTPGITVYNPANHGLGFDESGWPGEYQFSVKRDSLQLVWPGATKTTTKAPNTLGLHQGLLTITDSVTVLQSERAFEISRSWLGLVPTGAQVKDWWTVFGKETNVAPDDQKRDFSVTTNTSTKDSLTQLHSRFSLVGDFQFSLRIFRPPLVNDSCFLAIFLTRETKPSIRYQAKTGPTAPPGFQIDASAAGLAFNPKGTGGFKYSVVQLGFQTTDPVANRTIPQNAQITAKRRGKDFTFEVCNVENQKCETYSSPRDISDPNPPDSLNLHLVFGNFTASRQFDFTLSQFTITEGELGLP